MQRAWRSSAMARLQTGRDRPPPELGRPELLQLGPHRVLRGANPEVNRANPTGQNVDSRQRQL